MSFSLSTFIFEIINFLVLVYILQRLLYRPLHAMIDRRREMIARAQDDAIEARREAEELRTRLDDKIAQADAQHREIVAQAREDAAEQRRRLLDQAEAEARQQLEDAHRSIELERDDARKALQGDITSNALQLTERLLREAADSTMQEHLLQRLVSRLDVLSAGDREHIRRAYVPGSHAILESATAPRMRDLQAVQAAINTVLGCEVPLESQTNPDLIAGVRLRLDGHVWDASLAGPLQGALSYER